MSTVRLLPLGTPAAAALVVGGDLGALVLSVVAVLALLLVGRSVHHRLTPADGEVVAPRRRA